MVGAFKSETASVIDYQLYHVPQLVSRTTKAKPRVFIGFVAHSRPGHCGFMTKVAQSRLGLVWHAFVHWQLQTRLA